MALESSPLRHGLIVMLCTLAPFGGGSDGLSAQAQDARAVLRATGGFSDRDWATIQRGEAIARILDTDSREIAVAGIVRINASRDLLIARYRDIDNLKRSAIVVQVGAFGRVPHESDLRSLAFEDYDLDLRDCRPGNCRVRLAADDIARFHREVDWNGGDLRARSAAIWRDVLARYAAAYARDGIRALPVYTNKPEPLSVSAELRMLLKKADFVAAYSHDFYAYLQHFGPNLPQGAESLIYWTKEDFGIRPVVRITHQMICQCDGSSGAVLIATNQIYADHYLDASLGLTLAIAEPGSARPSFYLIAVNRARTRSLSGVLRAFVRATVRDRSRRALENILRAAKTGLERV